MCAENNKRPKFYKFLDYDGKGKYSLKEDGSTDGYWKLLIDFKMYDNNGVGAPQTAVTPEFSMTEAMTMLDEYKGGHQKYPIAHGVVDKFVDKFNNEAGLMRSDRNFSEKALDKYSGKEYNNFGWARANGILSARENADLRSKFAAATSNHITQPKTESGEYMIAIGDDVENKIVYMKGKIDEPIITRILEINETNETKLSEIRRNIYETERRGVQQETEGIFRRNDSSTFQSDVSSKRRIREGQGYNNRLGVDRGRGSEEAKRVVRFTVKEDGTTETTYSDGSVENDTIMHSDRRPNRDREILAEVLADSSLKQRYYLHKTKKQTVPIRTPFIFKCNKIRSFP